MDIRFEDRDAFTVVGYAVETDPSHNDSDLTELWDKYEAKLLSLPESNRGLYGVLWYTENHRYCYQLGVESGDAGLLENATLTHIPAAQFAIATVPQTMTVVEAWHEYFEKALPELGYLPDDGHGRYFERHHEGACELWTPVVKNEV